MSDKPKIEMEQIPLALRLLVAFNSSVIWISLWALIIWKVLP